MATTKKKTAKAEKAKATKEAKEEGVIWVSSFGDYFKEPKISLQKLHDFKRNVYAAAAAQKLTNLIFQDTFELTVKDSEGKIDETLTENISTMLRQQAVALDAKMQMAFSDVLWYGPGLFNPVWGYNGGNEYRLLQLRHLPARTFSVAPANAIKIYSQLLRGIVLNEDGELEFWQTAGDDYAGDPVQLKNVLMVKNPTSEELAGESVMVPLVPVIEMLKFSWRAQMQRVNRVGAPIIFIRISEPKGPSELNGNIGDIEWANKIVKNWGKDTGYALRDNMEIVDPHITDTATAMEVINALSNLLISFFSPSSFVSSERQLIASSDLPAQQMMIAYIKGIQQWLCDEFEPLVHTYLDANGYEGYTADISLQPPEIDRSELLLKQAEVGIKGKALMPNEIRDKLGNDPLDEEGLRALEDYWSRQQPAAASPFERDQQATEPPAKVERTMDEELQALADRFATELQEALAHEDEAGD